MALQPIMEAFQWGKGGRRMTPDEIAREREIAEALGQADTSPVGHWLEGAARMANAATGRIREGRANRADQRNQDELSGIRTAALGSLLGGQGDSNPVAAALAGGSAGDVQRAPLAPPADPASDRVAAAHSASAMPGQFSGSQQEFVDMLMPAAMEASKRTGIDPRIIVAQAAQETGWGRSAPGNNYFGIKSHGQGGGQNLRTHEYVDGQRVNINDSFRTFGSPEESVAGYADFITSNPRYRDFMGAEGLDAQLAALQASGYATDPNYSRSVGQIARGIEIPDAQMALESMAVGESMPMPSGDVASALAGPQQQPVQTAQAGGIDPAIFELLSHPAASAGDRQIAELLLGQHMQAQQAEQERMLAEQQMQQRLQAAQAAGIDPRFIGDDEIWKAGVGQQFQDPTTDIQEYEYARAQGFPGSFQDFQIAKREAGGVNVNVGQSEFGTIPPGYEMFTDPETGARSMRPIEGGPVEREIQDEERRAQSMRDTEARYAETVVQDTGISEGYLDDIPEMARGDGVVASNLRATRSGIPGTPEYNMGRFFESALDNLTLDMINRQRQGSSAGATGFGNMNEQQVRIMRGVLGRWEPGMPIEDQRLILHRLRNFYIDVQYGTEEERAGAVADGRMTQEENDAIHSLYAPVTRDAVGGRLGGQQEGAPAQINSEQDYIDLPSGAEFIAPDGSVRRKP